MTKDIYDMLLDKMTDDTNEFDKYCDENRFSDITAIPQPPEDLRFSDLDV